MIWRARKNASRISGTVAKQRKAPVLLFAPGLAEICTLLCPQSTIGRQASC